MLSKSEKLAKSRKQREELKQPRDWTLWWAYLIHVVQGMVAGFISIESVYSWNISLSVFSLIIVWIYLQYQHSSFLRKSDPVGRDIKDFGYGFALGALIRYCMSFI